MLNSSITYGNNTETTKTYDELNRLKTLNNGIKDYTYTYDNTSNILSDNNKNYTYDQLYRLTQVTDTNSGILLENFTYDNVGNRTSDTNNTEYTTNNLNQYISLSGATLSGTTNTSFIYDDNGNLTNDGINTYSYDYKNRLTKVQTQTGTIVEFNYDVLGRRYEKKTGTTTINYIYSNENVLTEYNTVGNTTTKKEYINGLETDEVLAVDQEELNLTTLERGELTFCQQRVLPYATEFNAHNWDAITTRCNNLETSGSIITTNRYYINKDHLGSTIGITDNSGTIVTTYSYDSYGNFTQSGTDIGYTRLFTGREYDKEINLYYYRARYYSPELGRFISRDPIDIQDDVNLYAYVGNNPVNFVDLMGLAKILVLLAKDKDGLDYEFDKDGYIINYENSPVRQQYNTFKKNNPNLKFEHIQINTFEQFDGFINDKIKRDKIYLFAHGNPTFIALDYKKGEAVFNNVISGKALKDTTQSEKQKEKLKNTIFITYACNSGNEDSGNKSIGRLIEEHYGFKGTYAPTKAGHGSLEVYDTKFYPNFSFDWNLKIYGLMNFFN